jgi:CO dehydrogenase nickel-insertion accessory protein CooC1
MTEGSGAGRIYWVGGSKGGVGKSMMTVAMDHLLEQGTKVVVVDWDTSNNVAVQQHGRTIDCRLEELRSQPQLLRELVDAVPNVAEHVLRHGCFVEDKEFERRRSTRGDDRAANASRPVEWPRQP